MFLQQFLLFLWFLQVLQRILLFSLLFASGTLAQSMFSPSPTVQVVDSKGEKTALTPGDSYSGEAPVRLLLSSGAEEVEGYSLNCYWEFFREGEDEPFLVRYDQEVEYDLRESGTTLLQPYVVYTSTADSEIFYEFGPSDFEQFSIVLSESAIEVPNAFSPNGDGINDYFNVFNVKSIISFDAAIYNRWGQQLYSWGIDKMNCEECGWDGTYKGKPVKAGVYYVVVKAKGADGIEYEFTRDVNLLRGYTEETMAP